MTAVNNQNLLQLRFIQQPHIDGVKPFFNHLPDNPYADGAFRKRRYSVLKFVDNEVSLQPTKAFVQDDSINNFQGNIERVYENLETDLINSDAFKHLLTEFRAMTGIEESRDIEVHQFRMLAIESDTPPAPEGVHQDGFDHVCVCGVSHENIEGGELLVYEHQEAEPCFKMEIKDGLFALVNDREVWHNATPMNKLNADEVGYLDCFVFTA